MSILGKLKRSYLVKPAVAYVIIGWLLNGFYRSLAEHDMRGVSLT